MKITQVVPDTAGLQAWRGSLATMLKGLEQADLLVLRCFTPVMSFSPNNSYSIIEINSIGEEIRAVYPLISTDASIIIGVATKSLPQGGHVSVPDGQPATEPLDAGEENEQ